MDAAYKVFRRFEVALDECPVDDEFCLVVGELSVAPTLDLLAHRLEVALHSS